MNFNETPDTAKTILRSFITRNEVVLVEFVEEENVENAHITELARKLQSMKGTPGWQYASLKSQWNAFGETKLKGAKFHILEHNAQDEDCICSWSIGCVYDPNALNQENVESFVKHVEEEMREFRENDNVWKLGGQYAAQHQFSPTLRDLMTNVQDITRIDEQLQEVDRLKDIMKENIEMILDRDEKLSDILEKAEALNAAAAVFKKNSKLLKRKMRQKYYWQLALYGSAGLTTVAGGIVTLIVLL